MAKDIEEKLIELGIMQFYPIKEIKPLPDGSTVEIEGHWDISAEIKEKLYQRILSLFNHNILISVKREFVAYLQKADLLLPDQRIEYLQDIVKEIISNIDNDYIYLGKENKHYILSNFSNEDYLKFHENELTNHDIMKQDFFHDVIKYEWKLRLIKKLKVEISKYQESKSSTDVESKDIQKFNPNNESLKDWIYPMHLSKYIEMEQELFTKNYIDNKGRWIKHSGYLKELAEFTFLILRKGYFNRIVKGIEMKNHRYRHFISERYLGNKLALSGMWKKCNKTFLEYTNRFDWIKSVD